MLPVTKPKKTTSAIKTKFSFNEPRFVFNNTENGADLLPTVSSDLNSPATMTACRVCLAMNVRMHHISEHKLRAMYERVTGMKINIKDKLPKKLCWECVARLSSANRFIEKALNTHWIMMNTVNKDRFVTTRDIKLIDKTLNRLESTLCTKYFQVNHSNFHIIENNNEINNEVVVEKVNNKYNENDKKTDNYMHENDIKVEFTEEEQIYIADIDTSNEKDPIKSEQVDVNEELEYTSKETDTDEVKLEIEIENTGITIGDISNELVISFEANTSNDGIAACNVDESYEMCEGVEENLRRNSPPRNQSDTTPRCKELIAALKNIMLSKYNTDSCKQLTTEAQTIKHNDNNPAIKNRILFKNKNNIAEDVGAIQYKADTEDTVTKDLNISAIGNTSLTTCASSNSNLIFTDMESSKQLFICDICSKPFHEKSALIRHTLKHPKSFYCSYCSYIACQRGDLTRHINAKHTKSTIFSCSYCSYKAFQKSSLTVHINAQHTKSTAFNCSYCNYKTYNKSSLNIHVKVKHTKSAVFNCSYCSFETYQKGSLKIHINAKHTKSSVFNCPYCIYKAYQRSTLNKHVNATHTKKTVFNCSYCSFKTYYKDTLNTHCNAKHTKSNVFNCPDCSYKTYDKSNFRKHLKTKHS